MADKRSLQPTIGAAWLRVLSFFEDFAAGTYTTFAATNYSESGMRSFQITLGLPGGGTDVWQVIIGNMGDGTNPSPSDVLNSPGFRNMSQVVFPLTLPSGDDVRTIFNAQLGNLRDIFFIAFCGVSHGGSTDTDTGLAMGIDCHYWCRTYYGHMNVVTDVPGVMYGTFTGDEFAGMSTNFVGGETIAAAGGGGGGGVDLTPVVDALEDIATMDVEYQANNGGTVWSMRGKVRAP